MKPFNKVETTLFTFGGIFPEHWLIYWQSMSTLELQYAVSRLAGFYYQAVTERDSNC